MAQLILERDDSYPSSEDSHQSRTLNVYTGKSLLILRLQSHMDISWCEGVVDTSVIELLGCISKKNIFYSQKITRQFWYLNWYAGKSHQSIRSQFHMKTLPSESIEDASRLVSLRRGMSQPSIRSQFHTKTSPTESVDNVSESVSLRRIPRKLILVAEAKMDDKWENLHLSTAICSILTWHRKRSLQEATNLTIGRWYSRVGEQDRKSVANSSIG